MKDFSGKLAVVTGGGSGMGRELVRQLLAEGCNVAMCDVSAESMAETQQLGKQDGSPQGTRISTHIADVSDETQVLRFRDDVAKTHATDKVHLLFNNAGIGGGGSLFTNSRDQWERTFNICWGGVYLCTRAFLPMLMKADKGHIVNTSSVNGFWASLGPGVPHTAYSAAKFAVKGFTEALINDLRVNAPHIKCSVVMPGHIGTSIVANSRKILLRDRLRHHEPRRDRASASTPGCQRQGRGPVAGVGCRRTKAVARARAEIRAGSSDDCRRRRDSHSRRRQSRSLAHSRRRRCPPHRRAGSASSRTGL